MSFVFISSLVLYSLATTCAVYLFVRMRNWRLRFLAAVIGIMPLHRIVMLLWERGIRLVKITNEIADLVELLVGALFLIALCVLELDSAEQTSTARRLRLAEAAPAPTVPVSSLGFVGPPAVAKLRWRSRLGRVRDRLFLARH